MNMEYSKILNSLQRQCVKREYCQYDIFRKALKAFEGDKDLARQAVDALVADKFVDDKRYAAAFAREKSRLNGWGPAKISFALNGKGISHEAISAALDDVDPDEASRKMRSVLEVKRKALEGDPQIKLKLLKFGLTRGYEYDVLAPVIDELISGIE
jgi:regulatory protein